MPFYRFSFFSTLKLDCINRQIPLASGTAKKEPSLQQTAAHCPVITQKPSANIASHTVLNYDSPSCGGQPSEKLTEVGEKVAKPELLKNFLNRRKQQTHNPSQQRSESKKNPVAVVWICEQPLDGTAVGGGKKVRKKSSLVFKPSTIGATKRTTFFTYSRRRRRSKRRSISLTTFRDPPPQHRPLSS